MTKLKEQDANITGSTKVSELEPQSLKPQSQEDPQQKLLKEIEDLRKKDKEDKPEDNPLKPDDSKQAMMMLMLCALFIIGAVATGGIGAQILGVFAGAAGLYGLKKAKDALFPATADSKAKKAHDKLLDAKVKELEKLIERDKGYQRGLDGGVEDPDKTKRENKANSLNPINIITPVIPKLSPEEKAGYEKGKAEKENAGKQQTSAESDIQKLTKSLAEVKSQLGEIVDKMGEKGKGQASQSIDDLSKASRVSVDKTSGNPSASSGQSIAATPQVRTNAPAVGVASHAPNNGAPSQGTIGNGR